jgi:hypothetical protein
MTFSEYVRQRDLLEMQIGTVNPVRHYKPGAIVPPVIKQQGGPSCMSPFKAQNPSRPVKPFKPGLGRKQVGTTIMARKH